MALTSPASSKPSRTPRFKGCSNIGDYEVLAKLGEGTFGEVHKARSKSTRDLVALKKILMHNEKDGFPITALREIKLLKTLDHINVLRLDSMAIERAKTKERKKAIIYMVTPYMDHDLSGLLENPDVRFSEAQIKCYMLQLLEGVRFLHNSHILHRDMKAANLLINNKGILQIADFGLARYYDEPAPRPGRGAGEARREYTALVVTRWYRPPELLLQLRRYTPAIDMWGVGCVFGEMFKRQPILAGKSDLGQAQAIFDLVGSPTEDSMPGWSSLPGCEGVNTWEPRQGDLPQRFREIGDQAISLLISLLRLDWRRRITAVDALQHPYFFTAPRPARPEDLPRYEDSHELDRRRFRDQKAAPPPAPAGGAVGMGPEGEWTNGQPSGRDNYRGGGWGRDGRGGMRGYDNRAYDHGPPPPYDSRFGPPPSLGAPPAQRPGWSRGSEGRGPPDTSLPPRPPVPGPLANGPRSVDRPRGGKDTYIPPYAAERGPAPPDARPAPPMRDDRDRRDYRDRDYAPAYRDRDRDYHRRDRDPYYDDRMPDGGMGPMSYEDDVAPRSKGYPVAGSEKNGGYAGRRPPPPMYEERDRGRERDWDRDRDKGGGGGLRRRSRSPGYG